MLWNLLTKAGKAASYLAHDYSAIMWRHRSGPVIGYHLSVRKSGGGGWWVTTAMQGSDRWQMEVEGDSHNKSGSTSVPSTHMGEGCHNKSSDVV